MTDEELFQKLHGQRFRKFTEASEAISKEAWNNTPHFRIPIMFDMAAYAERAFKRGWIQRKSDGADTWYEIVAPQIPMIAHANGSAPDSARQVLDLPR